MHSIADIRMVFYQWLKNRKFTRKFKKHKTYSSFRGADLADMYLISKYNKVIRPQFCAINI